MHTKEEVITALKICLFQGPCINCPFCLKYAGSDCLSALYEHTIKYIEEQPENSSNDKDNA